MGAVSQIRARETTDAFGAPGKVQIQLGMPRRSGRRDHGSTVYDHVGIVERIFATS
jgi:hypothetical protein